MVAAARRPPPAARRLAKSLVVAVVCAASTLACTGGERAGSNAEPVARADSLPTGELVLELDRALVLPDAFTLGGASLGSGSVVAAWDRQRSVVLVAGATDTVMRRVSLALHSVAFVDVTAPAGTMEVMDRGSRSLRLFAADTTDRSEAACRVPLFSIEDAVRTRDGRWYALGLDDQSRHVLITGAFQVCQDWRVLSEEIENGASLSRSDRGVWLSSRFPSVGPRRIKSNAMSPAQEPVVDRLPTFDGEVGEWVGLRTFDLDGPSLQTVADIRSEARVLVLRSPAGSIKRVSAVSAQWAIVDADASTRTLLAAHRADAQRLLVYKWRWEDSSVNNSKQARRP